VNSAAVREKHGGKLADSVNLRLWLRMLSLTTIVEKRLRRALETHCGTTMPRFDVLAALDRHPEGMRMTALSRELLVSAGNVTGVVRSLAREGMVEIHPVPSDGRAFMVRISPRGKILFDELANAHHQWVDDLLGELDADRRDALYDLLGAVKSSLARQKQLEKVEK
jgi:DNA-binding MarR family transcriptional regulator